MTLDVSLVVLEGVSLAFGRRDLISDLDLRVGTHDRVGLLGPNGSGKSTLLKMIADRVAPDSGKVRRRKGLRLGYLPQDLDPTPGVTVLQTVLSSVPGRTSVEQEADALEAELTTGGASEEKTMEQAERLAELHEQLLHFETMYSEYEAHRILAGLGFSETDHKRDLGELSGGWQMRAHLAALLFLQPDLLMLDEPTNHLDLPSVAWLSSFLRRTKGGLVLICHDREFLGEQIDRVVSLEPEGVRQYSGNYEAYRRQRSEEEIVLRNQAKNLEREREKAQQFIDRFRAQANKAKAVQSRVKQLEKMESVSTLEARSVIRFTFPPSARAGAQVITIDALGKAYGDLRVLSDVTLSVARGDRVGIIGKNGAGKTTLLRVVADEIPATEGRVTMGHGVKTGHYAQHHAEMLQAESTVLEEVVAANPGINNTRARTLLGSLLFRDEDVDKPIRVLSGGERARVALARLLVDPGNLMLMDEPTNHLDLESSEALAEALAGYDGTLVFVSHNRAFIRRLATRIWDVHDGIVEDYPGTLDEYMDRHRQQGDDDDSAGRGGRGQTANKPKAAKGGSAPRQDAAGGAADGTGGPSAPRAVTRHDRKAQKREEAQRRTVRNKRLGPLQKRIATLEASIAEVEQRQREQNLALADPAVYDDNARKNALLTAYQDDSEALSDLNERWEMAQSELEELQAADPE